MSSERAHLGHIAPVPQGAPGVLEPQYERVYHPRWPHWPLVWLGVLVVGVAGWTSLFLLKDAAVAWQAVLVNFLYFTPLAAGMVVWAAIVTACRGTWMGESRATALLGLWFAPVSIAAYFLLWIGVQSWAGWLRYDDLKNAAWVNSSFIYVRDGVALIVFWVLAYWFARRSKDGTHRGLAGLFILTYCLVFSLIGFDLVMALDPHWVSSLFGGYFFISGLYIAVAAWTLLSLMERPSARLTPVADLAKLIVAFSLLTTYMMYSQLLPMWYENMPHEVRFVIPRLQFTPWSGLSLVLLTTIYLGPLVFLLPRKAKTNVNYMRAAALLILVGMWFERWWLVGPTLGQPLSLNLPNIFAALMFLSLFALLISLRRRHQPISTMRRRHD